MLVAPPPQPVRGPDQITYRLNAIWTRRTFTLAGTESIHFRNNGSGTLVKDAAVTFGSGATALAIGAVDGAAGNDVLVAEGTALKLYSNRGIDNATAAHSLGINMGLADAEHDWQLLQSAAQQIAPSAGAQP